MRFMTIGVVALLAACASATSAPPPRPSHEVVSGAGRIHGGGVRMDVAVGHAIAREPVKSATTSARPTSSVVP